jgi:nucleoside-diphosphate-sugar epimerase
MKLAITGGTGFVGGRLLDAAIAAGHEVKALTRKAMPPTPGVEWVPGALDHPAALDALTGGTAAVIHVAGVISAPTAEQFDACNVDGTQAVLDAARRAGVGRFVHVSSLAAREPTLSLYGASKAKSERIIARSSLPWAIVRPPAVYGPGDKETLELFKMAKHGLILLPPAGHISLIHVHDLVALLLALAEPDSPSNLTVEADDGRPGGWTHKEFAQALATAVGRRAAALSVPAAMLKLGARVDRLFRGDAAKLTADRAAYFCHPDWVVDPARTPPREIWAPGIATPQGLASTAAWYRAQGWL